VILPVEGSIEVEPCGRVERAAGFIALFVPMLERLGAELVEATESLAREDNFRVLATHHSECLYASVIVTNVKLMVAEFLIESRMRNGGISTSKPVTFA
jgi:hypothetical protein